VIGGGTAVLITLAVAYILIVLSSNRRINEAQKTKAEEVAKSAERYKALFDHSLAGMMKFSIDSWKVHEANDSLFVMFGCRTEGELERCFSGFSFPVRQSIANALSVDGIITEYEVQTKTYDGRDIWVLFSARVIQGDEDVHAVIIDITKRKLFEAMVKEQAALLNETQDAIIVLGDRERITFWNRGAELTYGWEAGEVTGRPLQEILYDGDKKEDFQHIVDYVVQFQKWSGEYRHRKKDGKEILVDSRWRIIHGKNGSPRKLLIVNSDITTRKRLEAQFIKTQKMESIALLTGGIAHDLQNILAPVAMSIGLLRAELKDQTSLTVLRAVEESAQSGLQLVKNILTYGKGIIGERVLLDLSLVMQQVLKIIEGNLPPAIVVDTDISGAEWIVLGDMSQLKQVFLNICVNARDAMPEGGVMGIKLEDCFFDSDDLESYPEAHSGRYVVASVSDSGIGISEEHIDRIFEPFFTTKEGGEGTGLGLSIVLGIVRSHGGFVTADSIVHRGTTFRVYLPYCMEKGG
jgi:two-component system, cell cycle sensor histidine kinase and response regulator CckA